MKSSTISKIGIILYACAMGVFGVSHFMNAAAMSQIVPDYLPGGGKIWVYITGAALILAAIAFLTGKNSRLAGLLLALMLIIFVLMLTLPGLMHADEASKGMFIANLLKDTALAGGALVIAGRTR
jgi:uncharacterized membrane protein